MSDLFAPFTPPPPSPELKARVLEAAGTARRAPAALRALDVLGSSRIWWLAWSGSMVLLVALASRGSAPAPSGAVTAESWQRYRTRVAATLEEMEVTRVSGASTSPRGAS